MEGNVVVLCSSLKLFFSLSSFHAGSGSTESNSVLPGRGSAEAQGLAAGEEGVEQQDSSDFAERTRKHERELRVQHSGRGRSRCKDLSELRKNNFHFSDCGTVTLLVC